MIVEVLVGVLVAALLIVTTVMAYIGMLGILGVVCLVRCDRGGHLGVTSPHEPLRSCTYCRHGRLIHPLATLHHAHALHVVGHRSSSGS